MVDEEGQTVLAQLAAAVFGDGSLLFYGLQFGTFAILILAANTAYADFPRLARSSPGAATSPARSPTAATGWCSPTAS